MGAGTSTPLVFLFDYIEPSSEFRQGGLILNKIQEKIDPDKTSLFLPSEDGCFVASLQLEEVTLLSMHTSQDLHPRTLRNKRWPSIDLPAIAHVCFLKTMLPLPLLVLFPYTARRDVEYRLRQDEQLRHKNSMFFEFAENTTTTPHRAHLWDPNTGMVAPLSMGRPVERAVSANYQVVCWSQSKTAARVAIGYRDVVREQDSFFVVYDCSSADVARPEILFVHSFAEQGKRHLLSLLFSDTDPSILCALTRDDTASGNGRCLIFDCETHQTLNSLPLSRIQVFSQNDRDATLGAANGTFLVCCLEEAHHSSILGMNTNPELPTVRVPLPNHLRPLGFANIPCFLVCGDAKTATKKSTHFCRFFVDEKRIRFDDISCPYLDLRLCMHFIVQNPQTDEELLVYSCSDFSQAQVRPLDFCWSLPPTPAASAQILPSSRHQGLRKFLVWCYNQTVPERENLYEDAVSNSFLKLLALQPPNGIFIVKIPFLCRTIAFVRHELEEKEEEQEQKQESHRNRRRRRRGHRYQSSERTVLKEKLKSIETDFVVYELEGEIELDGNEFEDEQHHPRLRYYTRNQQRLQEQQQQKEQERRKQKQPSSHRRRRHPAKSVIVLNKKTEARLKFLETMTSTDITESTPFLEIPSLFGTQLFKRKSVSQLYDEYHEAKHFESEPSTATVEVFLHYLQDFVNVACTLILDGHGEAYRTNRYSTLPTSKSAKVAGIPFKTLAYFLHHLERFSSIIQFVVIETCSTGQTNLLQLLPNILLPFPILTMIFTDSVLQSQMFVTDAAANDAYFEALTNMDLSKIAQHTNKEAGYQYLGIRNANDLQVRLFSAQQSDGVLEITETMAEQRPKSEPLILSPERKSVLLVGASIVSFPIYCDYRSVKILSAAPGDVCHILDSLTISRRRFRDLQVIWNALASIFSYSYTAHKVFLVRRLTFCDIVFENVIFRPFYGNMKITCVSAKVDENGDFKSREDASIVAGVAESVRNLFIEYDGDPDEFLDDDIDAPLGMEISLSNYTDSGEEIVNNNVKNPVYATIWVENEAIQQTALRQVQRQRQLLWREYLLQRRFVHSAWQEKDESQHLVLESLNDIALWNHLLQKTYANATATAEEESANEWPLWLRLSALKETYHPLVAYLYENAKAYKQLLEQEREDEEME